MLIRLNNRPFRNKIVMSIVIFEVNLLYKKIKNYKKWHWNSQIATLKKRH